MVDRTVETPDGRVLRVLETGKRDGAPVFVLHGMPGCRLGPHPRFLLLHHLGVRLIAYDRPGYGGSTRLPLRRVEHAAADVAIIADRLGLERFCVVGRSGGAPHALACAARLPDPVERAAALVSFAPRDARGLDWYAGMTDSNDEAYRIAETGIREIERHLEGVAGGGSADYGTLLDGLWPELQPSDRRVVGDNGTRLGLEQAYAEALRNGSGGRADDVRSLVEGWGFDPAEITVPTLLWHGERDVFSPVGHTEWLAGRIPGAVNVIEPDAAHFSAMDALVNVVLPWFTSDSRTPRLRSAGA